MLKQIMDNDYAGAEVQPPSGGCVLKPDAQTADISLENPAAFRRLCVETDVSGSRSSVKVPAAFRRLCVETSCPSAAY